MAKKIKATRNCGRVLIRAVTYLVSVSGRSLMFSYKEWLTGRQKLKQSFH